MGSPQIKKGWMRHISTFVLMLALAPLTFAQNVLTGKVTDAKTGETLPGITLLVVGKQIGAVTGSDGGYRITIAPGNYQVRASAVNYKAQIKNVSVSGVTSLNFQMEEDLLGTGEVVILGTRREDRVVTDSPVPIDVITPKELSATGATETMQVIQAVVPSYNAPQSSVTDGTDHIKVATLRGLAPDQMLVLINGKRQHTSALVNINGSVGRGSTGIDMNSIPPSAIERVEVLRDGAAAQYGSDAIAGVINLILKQKTGFNATVNYGQYASTETMGYSEDEGIVDAGNGNIYVYNSGNNTVATANKASAFLWDAAGESGTKRIGNTPVFDKARNDGQTVNLNLGYGFKLGENGSLYLAAELIKRQSATRAGLDPRRNYFGINADGSLNTSDTAGSDDPREASFDRQNFQYGPGALDAGTLFFNGNLPLSERANLYAFGGYSARVGLTGCNFRQAKANQTVRAIYPDGFLPKINGNVRDYTASAGIKGTIGGWSYDLSEKLGQSSLQFLMADVINTSYGTGPEQKKEIDSGSQNFFQSTTNFDLFRQVNVGMASPLSVAVGAEFRYEHFFFGAGEPISYLDGGVKVLDGPNKGAATPTGCQCFPGFSPKSAEQADANRNSFGVYADLETKIIAQWLVSAAARLENYSDFGTNLSWKFATKFDVTEALGIRGAISTGFRAPSLQQSNYTTLSTNFINGIPFEIGTFKVDSPVAKALGAKTLQPETSFNLSAGLTFNTGNFALTVDAYQIDIKDRITFSDNFTGTKVQAFLESKGVFGSNGGRFFLNAVDTRTQGLDITGRYAMELGEGKLKVTAGLNFNKTEVTNASTASNNKFNRLVPITPELLAIDPAFADRGLFGRSRIGDYELAQPRDKQNFSLQYDIKNIGLTARVIRYGAYTSVNSAAPDATTGINVLDQAFDPSTLVDFEANYKFLFGAVLAVGVNNAFDVYPEKVYKTFSNNGIYPYSAFSPYGFNGRYVYSRLSYSF